VLTLVETAGNDIALAWEAAAPLDCELFDRAVRAAIAHAVVVREGTEPFVCFGPQTKSTRRDRMPILQREREITQTRISVEPFPAQRIPVRRRAFHGNGASENGLIDVTNHVQGLRVPITAGFKVIRTETVAAAAPPTPEPFVAELCEDL
jgi:hypothetical protein